MTPFFQIDWLAAVRCVRSACLFGACGLSLAVVSLSAEAATGRSLAELESELSALERELDGLARYGFRDDVGSIGFRSRAHETDLVRETLTLQLDRDYAAEKIALVPVIWRSRQSEFTSDGFPVEFEVWAGDQADTEGRRIAVYAGDSALGPRLGPLMIDLEGGPLGWVRVETIRLGELHLNPIERRPRFALQLAEIMVFENGINVALNCQVRASSTTPSFVRPWAPRYVVDGFTPYQMDAPGPESWNYENDMAAGVQPSLMIDLGAPAMFSRIHLYPYNSTQTVPSANALSLGFPRHLVLDAANDRRFSNPIRLAELKVKSDASIGPIVMLACDPGIPMRYVRLTALEPYTFEVEGKPLAKIGFSEIEVIDGGRNLALGGSVSAQFPAEIYSSLVGALTDGRNHFGAILPLQTWMEQLARRQDLEARRPLLASAISTRLARERVVLRVLAVTVVALLALACALVVVGRIQQKRIVRETRERIAADLHDEVGANLHSIALLGDMAKNANAASATSADRVTVLLEQISDLARRTGEAARRCTEWIETDAGHADLESELRRVASRLTADIEHGIEIDADDDLRRLSPRQQMDLILFYKECLTNVLRHAGASRVTTRLRSRPSGLVLEVTDNGTGMPPGAESRVPPSLKRRARMLRGSVVVEAVDSGGLKVRLTLPC